MNITYMELNIRKILLKLNLNRIENYEKNYVDEEKYTDPNLF